MSGNRKHGFMRSSRIGRVRPFYAPRAWQCAGCGREHGATVERTIHTDGASYCQRAFFAVLDSRLAS